jgi:hypothetical protein
MRNFKTLSISWHQFGRKDSVSQIFSFLALKAEAVGEVQILRASTATATWQTDFLEHIFEKCALLI